VNTAEERAAFLDQLVNKLGELLVDRVPYLGFMPEHGWFRTFHIGGVYYAFIFRAQTDEIILQAVRGLVLLGRYADGVETLARKAAWEIRKYEG
jgi:hypothetical protein